MVEIHLYGTLRRYAQDTGKSRDYIVLFCYMGSSKRPKRRHHRIWLWHGDDYENFGGYDE